MVNNLVFVQKVDGRASEQILPVQVQLQLGTAMRGKKSCAYSRRCRVKYATVMQDNVCILDLDLSR